MENSLECLIGTTVTGIGFIHDYVQIFTDRGGMNINNPMYLYDKCSDKAIDITSVDVASILMLIQGKTIVAVDFCEGKHVKFSLDNNAKIKVSLLDNNYACPEAMDIWHDETIIVVH